METISLNVSNETASTADLVKQALLEAKELVELEIQLAREEVHAELLQLKRAAIFGGVAVAAALLTASTAIVALVLALGGAALYAGIAAGLLLVVALGCAWYAYATLPKVPLERTRRRVKADIHQLKEHAA